MREGETVNIREALRELLSQSGMDELGELLRIKECWPGLVGEKIAGETKPYRLEGGRLYIGVRSHAWAQELHYRIGDIKRSVKEETGMEIREVIIRKINL